MADGTTTTFSGLWARSVAVDPARPFLRFESPDGSIARWSYGEFDEIVAGVAAAFEARGVGPDRGVHLALTNTPSFVAAWLAALQLGSHIVPSDPMATAPELAEHLRRTSPAVGLCARSRSDRYREAVAECGELDVHIVEVDEGSTEVMTPPPVSPVSPVSPVGSRTIGPLDRAAVMFTSGTTGRPKGVVISQANYAFAGTTMAAAAGLTADDRQLVVLPLFHANAQYYSFASAIAVGASVALMHTFSASRFVEQAARHGATHASLFAGPMRMILARGGAHRPSGDDPPLRLRHCWFAQNLAHDQYETLADWFGCRPRQLYGMTETIPAVLTDSAAAPRCDTMGFVTTGCQVEIHDADGRPCPAGTVGEIVVGGRQGVELFTEYLDDPATTAASFRGEWFLTGDRAKCDTEGRFHFDGRRSDVLKVSGENVSVVEVEAVLGAHPDVLDVVVVGAPDPIRDEVPVAFVVPTATRLGSEPDLVASLETWAEARLGKAKRPHRYVVVDDLPRTSVGKIRKFMLTEAAADTPPPVASDAPAIAATRTSTATEVST
jgi:crotonobetaine/carnitine-CoA ligase